MTRNDVSVSQRQHICSMQFTIRLGEKERNSILKSLTNNRSFIFPSQFPTLYDFNGCIKEVHVTG